MFIFTFDTQVEKWYSNVEKCGGIYANTLCHNLSIVKETARYYLSLPLKRQGLHLVWAIPLFYQISDGTSWHPRCWVHGFELGVHGFELGVHGFELEVHGFELGVHGFELGVHGFGGTGLHGFGGTGLHGFSLPIFYLCFGTLYVCPHTAAPPMKGLFSKMYFPV